MKLRDFIPPIIAQRLDLRVGGKKEDYYPEGRNRVSHKIRRQPIPKVDADMQEIRQAIDFARDPDNPTRYYLLGLYDQIMMDSHLKSQCRNMDDKVLESPFAIVDEDDNQNDDLIKLFKRTWFSDYMQHVLSADWYGHSLIEFHEPIPSKLDFIEREVSKVKLFWREHVVPERGEILIDPLDSSQALNYREMEELIPYYLETTETEDLGLLVNALDDVIAKNFIRSQELRYLNKYGVPFVKIGTEATTKEELDTIEENAANGFNSGYYIGDKGDEVEIVEPKGGGKAEVFEKPIKRADDANSKLISGGVVSDEKNFVGSAEIAERITNTRTKRRMRRVADNINEVLFPFLIEHYDYPLEGYEFVWLEVEEDDDDPEDTRKESNPDDGGGSDGKKTKPDEGRALDHSHIQNLYFGGAEPSAATQDFNLDELIDDAVNRIYDGSLAAGSISIDLAKGEALAIWEAVKKGWQKQLKNVKPDTKDYGLLNQFWSNIHIFSAFKNHQNTVEIASLLIDENGKKRTKSQFVKAAKEVNKKYYRQYLEAEYDYAQGTARMADKWLKFEERSEELPYLRYRTKRDGRVRDSHKALEGVTLKVDDPFWNTYAPKNGWRCRCDLDQLAGGEVKRPKSLPKIDGVFKHNPGKSGEVFNKKHPYFKVQKKWEKDAKKNFGMVIPKKPNGLK